MMKSAKEILEESTIVVLNEALKHGFIQLPRFVLKDKRLSFGARLTYAVLLSYAWQEGSCFPGQDRMSVDLGVTRRAVSKYLVELKNLEYVNWKRRGMGRTNIYYILDYKPLKIEADENAGSHHNATTSSHLYMTARSHKYNQNNRIGKNKQLGKTINKRYSYF